MLRSGALPQACTTQIACDAISFIMQGQVSGHVSRSRIWWLMAKQLANITNPVLFVKYTTPRIFLAISTVYFMLVHQLDVESAFIYAPLSPVEFTSCHECLPGYFL